MKCPVLNLDNESVGEIELDDAVFGLEVRRDLLARAVNWQLARRRSGNHKAKGRSEVTGTTKKLYKQKGTGRARHGSRKAPIFRGGGVVFGPVVRDHAIGLPKKVRKLALKSALASKRADGKLVILESAELAEPKTRELARRLGVLGWSSVLVIDGERVNEGFARAARNIPCVDVLPQIGANVYDILRRDTLVLTKDAVQALEARLK